MRKLIALLFAVITTIAAFSCTKENVLVLEPTGNHLELTAGFEGETKTALQSDLNVRWSQTDKLSVSEGKTSSPFSIKTLSKDALTAIFEGTVPNATKYWALYPYQENLIWKSETVTATLPSVQSAVASSFADEVSLAVAEVINQNMTFKNIGGILAFGIHDDGIKAIELTSNDSTPLSGKVQINATRAACTVSQGASSVILKGNFIKGNTYYMTILPGVHAKGFKLTFYKENGLSAEFNANKSLTVNRNDNVELFNMAIPANKWKTSYKLVKDISTLKEGDIVCIGCSSRNAVVSAYNNKDALTATNNSATIVSETLQGDAIMEFTLGKETNGWTFQDANKNYLGASNLSVSMNTKSTSWTVTIASDGSADITSVADRYLLHATTSSGVVKNYKKSKSYAAVQLYRKTTLSDLGIDTTPDPTPEPTPDPTPDPTPTPVPGNGKPALNQAQWLEIPGTQQTDKPSMYCVSHHATMGGKQQRNFSILYDSDTYTSLWVAYPLCQTHMNGTTRKENWNQVDPGIPAEKQQKVNVTYQTGYDRGHQLPDASRRGCAEMQEQTYYPTNMTPQNSTFNRGIWKSLEEAVRNSVPTTTGPSDTVYVTTGAAFQSTPGGNEAVTTIIHKDSKANLPVPNYYWKVFLKVKRDAKGNITDAKTAAFWFPVAEAVGKKFPIFETTVDDIEAKTGFDFFVNLPDDIENRIEKEKGWSTFQNF